MVLLGLGRFTDFLLQRIQYCITLFLFNLLDQFLLEVLSRYGILHVAFDHFGSVLDSRLVVGVGVDILAKPIELIQKSNLGKFLISSETWMLELRC